MGRQRSKGASQNSNDLTRTGCVNCSNPLPVTAYVALFKLPGRILSVLEALELVFHSARSILRDVTPSTSSNSTTYKFCHKCGDAFGQVLKPLFKFLKFTVAGSLVSRLTQKSFELQENKDTGKSFDVYNSSNPIPSLNEDVKPINELEAECSVSTPQRLNLKEVRETKRVSRSWKTTLELRHDSQSDYENMYTPAATTSDVEETNSTKADVMDRPKPKYTKTTVPKTRKWNRSSKPQDNEQNFKCDICSTEYESAIGLLMHKGTHVGTIHERPYSCDKCNTNYKDRKGYRDHLRRSHPDDYRLFPCLKKYAKRRELTEEEQDMLKTTEFKCAEWPCENNSIIFSTLKEWLMHQKTVHHLSMKRSGNETDRILDTWQHIRPCPRCGKRLYGKQKVLDHIRIVHLGQNIYTCDICNKSLNSSNCLQKHMEIFHSLKEPEPFLCSQCGVEFKTIESLKSHERSCHEMETLYQCSLCQRKYFYKSHLRDHMITAHSSSNELSYSCTICGKGFKVKKQFRAHRDRHMKRASKDEACEFCGKSYSFKMSLKEHLISVHKLSPEEARQSAKMRKRPVLRTRILSTGEVVAPKELKPQKVCTYCGRQYARRDQVYVHLMSAHGITEAEAASLTQFKTNRKLAPGPGGSVVLLKMTEQLATSQAMSRNS